MRVRRRFCVGEGRDQSEDGGVPGEGEQIRTEYDMSGLTFKR